jgi:hypothetical protein
MPGRHIVSIRTVNCQTLLSLSEDDRAAASMFYIGYTASRIRRATIDVAELSEVERPRWAIAPHTPAGQLRPLSTRPLSITVDNGQDAPIFLALNPPAR